MADIKKNVNVNVKTTGAKKATKELQNLNDGIKKTNRGSRQFDRNMKGNSQMSANASKNFSKQAQGMQGILVPAYAEVAARVFALTAAYGALSRAADFAILLRGQELYAQQTGKNLSQIAKSLQEATGYMLDFQEASQGAALATTAGLNTTQLEDIAKVAKGASAALGRSLPDAFDRLTRGIVKGEPEILDELGLIIRLDDVYRNYAKTLNTTAAELTEFQKLQARQQAVVEQQGLTKYGAIAEGIDANQFERLRASSFDLLKELSQGVIAVFNPVAKFLAESQGALALIFALVAKSLATKIFPALESIGKKLGGLPESMKAKLEVLKQSRKDLAALETKYNKKSLDSVREMSKLKKMTSKMALREGSVLEQMFGLSQTGTLTAKQKARFIKAAREAIKSARTAISQGRDPSGSMVGQTSQTLDAFENQVNRVEAAQNNVVKGSKRIAIGFKGAGVAIKEKFTMVAIASMEKLQKPIKVVTKLISGLGKAINIAMRAFAVIQVLSFIGDLASGLSRTFSKSTEAVNDFSQATNEALTSIDETKVELNPVLVAGNFKKALEAAKFRSNIADGLSTSFNKAIRQIDLNVATFSDGFAKLYDWTKSIFGQGVEDGIGEGIANGIRALSRTGYKFNESITSELFTRGIISERTAEKLKAGISITAEEAQLIEDAATASDARLNIIKLIGAATDDNARKQKLYNMTLQAAADSAKKIKDAIKDLNESFKVKTPFDKSADAFKDAIKSVDKVSKELKPEAYLENFGAITPGLKKLQDFNIEVEREETRIAKLRAENNDRQAFVLEKNLQTRMKDVEGIKSQIHAELELMTVREAAIKRFGFDPEEGRRKLITIQENTIRNNQKLALLDQDSIKALEIQKTLKLSNLQLERDNLSYQLKALQLLPKAEQSEESILQAKKQLENKEREIRILRADNSTQLELEAKLLGKTVELRDKELNQIAMKKASGLFSDTQLIQIEESETLAKAVEYTRQSVLYITDSFKDAIKNIADSFKTAVSDAVVDWVEGTDNANIRETLGKSLTRQGADIAGGVVSEGVFGRTGLLGSAMDALGLGGLADDIIPKTQLEIAREDLKVQNEILNELRFQNGLGKVTDGSFISQAFSMIPFANGGIAKGGFKMYANGGVATQPHVGVIGEGKYNEAIVPLPDGKSIPVMGSTGGVNNVTVNVSVDSNGQGNAQAQGDGGNMKELGYQLSQIVQDELVKQQRPGGLLSSY